MGDERDDLTTERGPRSAATKSAVYAEFIKEYGEHADWEQWLDFLKKRPELRGFSWARSLDKR